MSKPVVNDGDDGDDGDDEDDFKFTTRQWKTALTIRSESNHLAGTSTPRTWATCANQG